MAFGADLGANGRSGPESIPRCTGIGHGVRGTTRSALGGIVVLSQHVQRKCAIELLDAAPLASLA
ncbi:hypothetical protein BJY17_002599 [Agromyces hippuratus]|uniref:Uncharacterized protein n=2 Tax=Agromyces hippuratus TaxID=286438 RepID=A0A852WU82_9MICO|nr:hypothetical protein [Agromyces hippuratus]NYG21852.1 hypothetical protein [Agromyces hippuratus]